MSTEDRTKHETLLLILHYLEEEGMSQSAQTLRDEISAAKRTFAVYFFCKKTPMIDTPIVHTLCSNSPHNILINYEINLGNGEWNDAHALVKQISKT